MQTFDMKKKISWIRENLLTSQAYTSYLMEKDVEALA